MNLQIRLSNDGFSKSIFYNLKLNFIRTQQQQQQKLYRIVEIEILNVDNFGINLFNFNKYLQTVFNSTINSYDQYNKKLKKLLKNLLQLNNIGSSSRKTLQIIDEFKTKLASNHDYIKLLSLFGFNHKTVCYTKNFVTPLTNVHTQNVEYFKII